MEPILKTENLWKVYRTGRLDVPALSGINFEVLPGEFVSIMGPSGCGKSTLLHVIGGLTQATRGRVFLDGNDLAFHDRCGAHAASPPQGRLRFPAFQSSAHARCAA